MLGQMMGGDDDRAVGTEQRTGSEQVDQNLVERVSDFPNQTSVTR